MNDLPASSLAVTCLAAVAFGAAHALMLVRLAQRLVLRTESRLTARVVLLLVQPLLRLGLATLAALAFWRGGIGPGIGAVAGFWLGRTLVVLMAWRLNWR